MQVLSVAEEVGELVSSWRGIRGCSRTPSSPAELAHEIADVVISSLVLARLLGIDLDLAIQDKMTVVADRLR